VRTSELAAILPDAVLERLNDSPVWRNDNGAVLTWREAAASARGVKAACSRLPEEARAVLTAIVRRYGPGPFEEEQLADAAGKELLREAEMRRGLSQLRGAGIVFTLRKAWGDRMHFIPQDAFAPWLDALCPAQFEPAEADGKRSVRLEGGYRFPFSLQLLHMLAALAHAGLQLTNRGVLPKRTAMAMLRRLEIQASEIAELQVQCPQHEPAPYERPLTILLDAAIALGLLRIDPEAGVMQFQADRLSNWLACRADVRESVLYALIFDRYAAYDSRFSHAAAALAMLPCGVWYLTDRLDAWLQALQTEGAGRWTGWVNALCGFGWLQRGRTPDGREAVRWTMDPAPSGSLAEPVSFGLLRFLPGGDMIAPPDLDYRIRWELELLASPASPGPMTLYRCSGRSVMRFFQHGRTREEAERVLSEAAGCALPEDLRRMLESWAEEAAVNMQASPAKGASVGDWPIVLQSSTAESAALPLRELGLVSAPFAPHLYRLDYDMPDPRPAVREAISRIPASWLKQLREYHPTTRREMLKQAIALGAAVRIEREGKLCEFLPSAIEDADSGWLVRGLVKLESGSMLTSLTPDMWKRMQLHVME
jgi:hypothetical protein